MKLIALRLFHFRNYGELNQTFSDGVNILYGPNGTGKTNILEAIYYLAITRSFRTKVDRYLIQFQQEMFRIQGVLQNDQGKEFHTTIAYSLREGKRLTIDQQRVSRFTDYIGEIPIVLLCPDDLAISQGSPQQRRRFLDILLSQSSKNYLHHLVEYRRCLKQRNALLQREEPNLDLIISWEEGLIQHGVPLIQKRREAVHILSDQVKNIYSALSQSGDKAKMIYQSTVPGTSEEELTEKYRQLFSEKRQQELELGITLIGPHRDDMLFLINGKPLRQYASQGEHKTFVVALKMAEYAFLQAQKSQSPILLFDDIFGELDAQRISQMLTYLGSIGQVFVTTTSPDFFHKVEKPTIPITYYAVKGGILVPEGAQAHGANS